VSLRKLPMFEFLLFQEINSLTLAGVLPNTIGFPPMKESQVQG
jgi:hypothetical protein